MVSPVHLFRELDQTFLWFLYGYASHNRSVAHVCKLNCHLCQEVLQLAIITQKNKQDSHTWNFLSNLERSSDAMIFTSDIILKKVTYLSKELLLPLFLLAYITLQLQFIFFFGSVETRSYFRTEHESFSYIFHLDTLELIWRVSIWKITRNSRSELAK